MITPAHTSSEEEAVTTSVLSSCSVVDLNARVIPPPQGDNIAGQGVEEETYPMLVIWSRHAARDYETRFLLRRYVKSSV